MSPESAQERPKTCVTAIVTRALHVGAPQNARCVAGRLTMAHEQNRHIAGLAACVRPGDIRMSRHTCLRPARDLLTCRAGDERRACQTMRLGGLINRLQQTGIDREISLGGTAGIEQQRNHGQDRALGER